MHASSARGGRHPFAAAPSRKEAQVPEPPKGCARVTGTVAGAQPDEPQAQDQPRKEAAVTARVGQKAPDFTAPAYHRGGFTSVQLSGFAGKWVLLCFYPGDFTFV
jgi:peroxiredoxin (alkyl hydroperoxide reductase subunit C)